MGMLGGRPDGYMRIKSLYSAAKFPYIQINPPWARSSLIFDIDHADGANAWMAADLPEPMVAITNKENGHAHLVYALHTPVLIGSNTRRKPEVLLSMIYGAMAKRLKADRSYTGPLAKNPLNNKAWDVKWFNEQPTPYELKFLAKPFTDSELKSHRPYKRKRKPLIGEGRNVFAFYATGEWAYQEIRSYWNGDYYQWHGAVMAYVDFINRQNSDPMAYSECKSIANSVARFVWKHFTAAKFSDIQRARQARQVKSRRENNAKRDAEIIEARLRGETQTAIAAAHGLRQPRVSKILAEAGLK